eukprot:COSAG03_NODE_2073_length_3155_cov_3.090314_4_plen_84_part_00
MLCALALTSNVRLRFGLISSVVFAVTMYPAAYINRNPFNAHLREDGGSTYLHYNGKYGQPVFEFGRGLVRLRTGRTLPLIPGV